jgi:hypothetical protein
MNVYISYNQSLKIYHDLGILYRLGFVTEPGKDYYIEYGGDLYVLDNKKYVRSGITLSGNNLDIVVNIRGKQYSIFGLPNVIFSDVLGTLEKVIPKKLEFSII